MSKVVAPRYFLAGHPWRPFALADVAARTGEGADTRQYNGGPVYRIFTCFRCTHQFGAQVPGFVKEMTCPRCNGGCK